MAPAKKVLYTSASCRLHVFLSSFPHLPSAAAGRGSGGGVSGPEDAAAAGAGAPQRVPEQDQDANGRSARQGAAGAGAAGLPEEGAARAESKEGPGRRPVSSCQEDERQYIRE